MRNIKVVLVSFIALAIFSSFLFLRHKSNQIVKLPVPNEIEYTKQFNDWAKTVKKHNKTPEIQAREEAQFEWLKMASKKTIQKIEFYGKIVDQEGNPVSGVTINYIGSRSLYASGSGSGSVVSDSKGNFVIDNARGKALKIVSFEKIDYQFPSGQYFHNPKEGVDPKSTWGIYKKGSPYIVKSWKVDAYPKVKQKHRLAMIFEPDGRKYTLDITGKQDKFIEGELEGDMHLSFDKAEANWRVQISALNGGFVESNDKFMYMAPEKEYQPTIFFESDDLKRSMSKNVYFFNENKRLYGMLSLNISPYSRNNKSAIGLRYVINLEQGRNLTVKQR